MIVNNMGTIVLGSDNLETSVANAEIIPNGARIVNLSFANTQECHVIINNGSPIYLRGNQGQLVDVCFSLKVVEAGITYNWTGQSA